MAAIFVITGARAQPAADANGPAIDAVERSAVIEAVITQISNNYVFPDAAKKMEEAIRRQLMNHAYDGVSNCGDFAKALTEDLHNVCHDRHLGVDFSPGEMGQNGDDGPSPEDIRKFEEGAARHNYYFRKVEALEGGIGLLNLGCFYPAEMISDTAAAAMSFLANSEAVIIDLRDNHGFAPSGGTLIASYFFSEETHLSDQYNRAEGTTRQFWTLPSVLGKRLADKDLYILTSHQTFSAPESFAYDLQALKRAIIVGERTGGGAHGTLSHRVNNHFTISVPFSRSINPVTKTDWEGTGVKPDIEVPAEYALLTAEIAALEKAAARHAKEPMRAEAFRAIRASKMKELADLKQKDGKR
jgi:retinol-binding protein 3